MLADVDQSHGLVAVLSVIATGFGAWLLKLFAEYRREKRKDREIADGPWKQVADKLQKEIDELREEHQQCVERDAERSAENKALKAQLDQQSKELATVKDQLAELLKAYHRRSHG